MVNKFKYSYFVAAHRMTTVEIIRQNRSDSSSIRLQVAAISCDECGAIPWDELQVYIEIYLDFFLFFFLNQFTIFFPFSFIV